MTKRSLLLWCAGLLFLTGFSASDLQAQYAKPPDAYTLTELNAMFGVPVTMHVERDGAKAIIENSYDKQPGGTSGGHTRSLYDLQEKTTITWDVLNTSTPCGKSTWSGDWGDPFAGSTEMTADLEKSHAQEVGPATVNGIQTKLYTAAVEGTQAKVWIEPKYGLVIKLEMTGADGVTKTMLEVKQLSFAKPAASTFTLPANCAAAANAPRTPTEQERITAETAGTGDYVNAIMGPPDKGSCTVSLRVVKAGTMDPIASGFQVAVDPNVDIDHPASYTSGIGANGQVTFSGGHVHEITARTRSGIVSLGDPGPQFQMQLAFGNHGSSDALIYRKCFGPNTTLLFVVKNPDKLSDGADWLWVKSGKFK